MSLIARIPRGVAIAIAVFAEVVDALLKMEMF